MGTYTGTQEGMPTKVIFQANGQGQTADLDFVNHRFYYNGGSWDVNVVPARDNTLLYNNYTSKWNKVYCYAWDRLSDKNNALWPGVEITERDVYGHYVAHVSSKYDMVIFNDGTENKITDSPIADWHMYNENGFTTAVNVALTDGVAYTSTHDVYANNVVYSRAMSNQWGTMPMYAILRMINLQTQQSAPLSNS